MGTSGRRATVAQLEPQPMFLTFDEGDLSRRYKDAALLRESCAKTSLGVIVCPFWERERGCSKYHIASTRQRSSAAWMPELPLAIVRLSALCWNYHVCTMQGLGGAAPVSSRKGAPSFGRRPAATSICSAVSAMNAASISTNRVSNASGSQNAISTCFKARRLASTSRSCWRPARTQTAPA